MLSSMFHMQAPLAEKILRPVIMYVVLIAFLRIFGKRELAQLNPFDLVVLLSLANTVQNAIIGNDNSVTGGVVGAFALLAINWLLMRLLYRFPRVNAAMEGKPTVLIRDGKIDEAALKTEALRRPELMTVLHKDGVESLGEVQRCTLEPNGTFYIERSSPAPEELDRRRMMEAVEALRSEVAQLRQQLLARG